MAANMLGRRFSEMSSDRDRIEESTTEAKGYVTEEGYVQEIVSTAPPRISAANGEVVQVVTRRKTVTTLGPDGAATLGGDNSLIPSTAPRFSYQTSIAASATDAAAPSRGTDVIGGGKAIASTTPAPAYTTAANADIRFIPPTPSAADSDAGDFPSFYKGSQASSTHGDVAAYQYKYNPPPPTAAVATGFVDASSPTPKLPTMNSTRHGYLDTTSPPMATTAAASPLLSGINRTPSQGGGGAGRGQQMSSAPANLTSYTYTTSTVGEIGSADRPPSALRAGSSRPYGTGRFVQMIPTTTTDTMSDGGNTSASYQRRSVTIGSQIDTRVIEPSRVSPIRPQPGYAPVKFVTRAELQRMREANAFGSPAPPMGPRSSVNRYEDAHDTNNLARGGGGGGRGGYRLGTYDEDAYDNGHYFPSNGRAGGGGRVHPRGFEPSPVGGNRQLSSPYASGNGGNVQTRWAAGGDSGGGAPRMREAEYRFRAQQQLDALTARGGFDDVDENNNGGYDDEAYDPSNDYDNISLASSAQAQFYKDKGRLQQQRNGGGGNGGGGMWVPRDEDFYRDQQQGRRSNSRGGVAPREEHFRNYDDAEGGGGGDDGGFRRTYSAGSDIGYNRLGVLRDGDRERRIAASGNGGRGGFNDAASSLYKARPTSYTGIRDLAAVDLDVTDVADYLAAMRRLPPTAMPRKPLQSSEAFLVVTRGTYLIKYNKNSQPHERFFALRMIPEDDSNGGSRTHPYLVWSVHDKSAGFKSRIHLSYLMQAVAGAQSESFRRMRAGVRGDELVGPYVGNSKCTVPTTYAMTFVFQSANTYRTVDVVALDDQTFRCWMIVMSFFSAINSNVGGVDPSVGDVGTLAPDTSRSQSASSQYRD